MTVRRPSSTRTDIPISLKDLRTFVDGWVRYGRSPSVPSDRLAACVVSYYDPLQKTVRKRKLFRALRQATATKRNCLESGLAWGTMEQDELEMLMVIKYCVVDLEFSLLKPLEAPSDKISGRIPPCSLDRPASIKPSAPARRSHVGRDDESSRTPEDRHPPRNDSKSTLPIARRSSIGSSSMPRGKSPLPRDTPHGENVRRSKDEDMSFDMSDWCRSMYAHTYSATLRPIAPTKRDVDHLSSYHKVWPEVLDEVLEKMNDLSKAGDIPYRHIILSFIKHWIPEFKPTDYEREVLNPMKYTEKNTNSKNGLCTLFGNGKLFILGKCHDMVYDCTAPEVANSIKELCSAKTEHAALLINVNPEKLELVVGLVKFVGISPNAPPNRHALESKHSNVLVKQYFSGTLNINSRSPGFRSNIATVGPEIYWILKEALVTGRN